MRNHIETIDYRSAAYLCEKYREVEFWNWNPKRLGVFLNSFLLIGDPRKGKKSAQIDESSFLALIKFANTIADLKKIEYKNYKASRYELFTPEELIEQNPRVKAVRWTATKIGIFLSTNLLFGIRKSSSEGCLITKTSFELLINHTLGTINRRKKIFLG